jgi:hypothetical protein
MKAEIPLISAEQPPVCGAPSLPLRGPSLGLGVVQAISGAGRYPEAKGSTSPAQSDLSESTTGPATGSTDLALRVNRFMDAVDRYYRRLVDEARSMAPLDDNQRARYELPWSFRLRRMRRFYESAAFKAWAAEVAEFMRHYYETRA